MCCRRAGNCFALGLIAACFSVSNGCVEISVPDPAVRYVAFGDSTTAGASNRDYPDILRELLGEPPETFANAGHGGETTTEGLVRLSDILEAGLFPNAMVWFYWEGGNDVIEFVQAHDPLLLFSPDDPGYPFEGSLAEQLADSQTNIEAAIALLHDARIEVFVATSFPVREGAGGCPPLLGNTMFPQQAEHANAYIARMNERIKMAVTNQEAFLVDVAAIGEQLRADQANYIDCNHLSVQGNEIVAAVFADAIRASPE